jgi:micrococcal nuclease
MVDWTPMRLLLIIFSYLLLTLAVEAQSAKVTHVSDGDSFIIATGERVRMIGINTPELADEFGPESKAHLSRLIRGKTVVLERDPLNDDRDQHGRLLRFVQADGSDINRQMIAEGYAYAFLRYPFARERRDAYRLAEQIAKEGGLGIWSATAANGQPWSNNDPRDPTPQMPASDPANDPGRSESFISRNVVWVAVGLIVLVIVVFAVRSARG